MDYILEKIINAKNAMKTVKLVMDQDQIIVMVAMKINKIKFIMKTYVLKNVQEDSI